ncbi:E3 ubiquitin-protein ligase RHA2A [Citrus sinensis]|uniref:E3 ubiquitin-protein ligase RHA2A n=2 Tax=Citrus sinensis TaxID=2711 RepID=A0ACB8NA16_CITSI|nr:E3 ubiquitin-protein ligase RHA2A [Citrus sinensis]KDO76837.1 hypothetical protein CISIN_1g030323mg [Citrus sinensis]
MGLHGQLIDLSSDSLPLLIVALIANCFGNLRSLLFSLLHSVGMTRVDPVQNNPAGPHVGSGLASLIVLAEQLNKNRAFSYKYNNNNNINKINDNCCCGQGVASSAAGSDCMVCLCTLRDGELVRKLDCRHVFHKDCLDGWLHHLNFNCPLCRSPVVSEERVWNTRRRVGGDLIQWFSLR